MKAYNQEKIVGEGSFGKALLCRRKNDNKKCIIKQISLSKMSRKEALQTEQEAKLLSRLNHPNIVTFWESFQETAQGKNYLFIVMEYADGGDLSNLIKNRKNRLMSENQILNITVQISLAMKHVHDRKILHRDLKSQNIFLTSNGIVKLGDFGIAKVLRNTGELASTQIGTPYFMSPEILAGKRYNNKTDIWSLGCVVYELTTLKIPFQGNSMKQLVSNIINNPLPTLPTQYSTELRSLIKVMLAKNYKERPSINTILMTPLMRDKIGTILSDQIRQKEFSHTILHGDDIFKTPSNSNISATPVISSHKPTLDPINEVIPIKNEKKIEDKKFQQPYQVPQINQISKEIPLVKPLQQPQLQQPQLQPQPQPVQRQNSYEMDINQRVAAHMERIKALREAQYQAILQPKQVVPKERISNIHNNVVVKKKSQEDIIVHAKPIGNVVQRNDIISKQQDNHKKIEKNERIRPPSLKPAIPKQDIYSKKEIPKSKPPIKPSVNNQLKVEGRIISNSPKINDNKSNNNIKINQIPSDRLKKNEQLKNQIEIKPQKIEEKSKIQQEIKIKEESKVINEPNIIPIKKEKPKPLANNWFNDLQLQMNNLKNQIQELQSPPISDNKISQESFNKEESNIQKNIENKKLVVPIKMHSPPNSRTPNSSVSSKVVHQIQQQSPNRNNLDIKNKKDQILTSSDDPLILRKQKRENERKNFRDFLKNQRQMKNSESKTPQNDDETFNTPESQQTNKMKSNQSNHIVSFEDDDDDKEEEEYVSSPCNLNNDFSQESNKLNQPNRVKNQAEELRLKRDKEREELKKMIMLKRKEKKIRENEKKEINNISNIEIIESTSNYYSKNNSINKLSIDDSSISLTKSSFFKYSSDDIDIDRKRIFSEDIQTSSLSIINPLPESVNDNNNIIESNNKSMQIVNEDKYIENIDEIITDDHDNNNNNDDNIISEELLNNEDIQDSISNEIKDEDIEFENLIQVMKNVLGMDNNNNNNNGDNNGNNNNEDDDVFEEESIENDYLSKCDENDEEIIDEFESSDDYDNEDFNDNNHNNELGGESTIEKVNYLESLFVKSILNNNNNNNLNEPKDDNNDDNNNFENETSFSTGSWNDSDVDDSNVDLTQENGNDNHLTVYGIPFPLGKTICSKNKFDVEINTPASRMEALREYLENALGTENFIKVYRLLKSVGPKDDDDELLDSMESIVGIDGLQYMDVFIQLINIEDRFES